MRATTILAIVAIVATLAAGTSLIPIQHVNAQSATGNPHPSIPTGQGEEDFLVLGIQKEIAVVPPICMGMGLIFVKHGDPILIFLKIVV